MLWVLVLKEFGSMFYKETIKKHFLALHGNVCKKTKHAPSEYYIYELLLRKWMSEWMSTKQEKKVAT